MIGSSLLGASFHRMFDLIVFAKFSALIEVFEGYSTLDPYRFHVENEVTK